MRYGPDMGNRVSSLSHTHENYRRKEKKRKERKKKQMPHCSHAAAASFAGPQCAKTSTGPSVQFFFLETRHRKREILTIWNGPLGLGTAAWIGCWNVFSIVPPESGPVWCSRCKCHAANSTKYGQTIWAAFKPSWDTTTLTCSPFA